MGGGLLIEFGTIVPALCTSLLLIVKYLSRLSTRSFNCVSPSTTCDTLTYMATSRFLYWTVPSFMVVSIVVSSLASWGEERMGIGGGDRRQTKQTKQKGVMIFDPLYIPICSPAICRADARGLTSPATHDRELWHIHIKIYEGVFWGCNITTFVYR